jgi:hypothetical protein
VIKVSACDDTMIASTVLNSAVGSDEDGAALCRLDEGERGEDGGGLGEEWWEGSRMVRMSGGKKVKGEAVSEARSRFQRLFGERRGGACKGACRERDARLVESTGRQPRAQAQAASVAPASKFELRAGA